MQGCESVCPCPFVLKQRGVDSGHSDLLMPEIMVLCGQRKHPNPVVISIRASGRGG